MSVCILTNSQKERNSGLCRFLGAVCTRFVVSFKSAHVVDFESLGQLQLYCNNILIWIYQFCTSNRLKFCHRFL